ncbi:MAG: hypothetical protein ISR95_02950 [Candidatus Marinimicrobia bacterium]|nr:hypothetical protein [Candidatus Neomarinimicrobiota bacterium]
MKEKDISEDAPKTEILSSTSATSRPSWANTSSLFKDDQDQIRRIGYDVVGHRDINKVRDSIKYELKNLLSGDVETRVERTIVDSLSSQIVGIGKDKEIVREHMMTIVSRHYSPPLTFNGNYDRNEHWTDTLQDTIWVSILFNKKRYIIDQRTKIIEQIEKAQVEAYKFLELAFNKLSYDNDVEAALTALGVGSYYISKGGGEAELPDIVNPGTITRISFQREELIKEIDKAIQLQFINQINDVTISRDDVSRIKLRCTNPKNYDLSRVKIRISSKPNLIEHPSTIKLDGRGMAEFSIAINPQVSDPFNKDVRMDISFDIYSETILPDKDWKNWVNSDDYFDLLVELPTISLPIHTVDFLPRSTWAIVSDNFPNSGYFKMEELQSELERSLSRHSSLFQVVERQKWPIGYKKYQQYKSGSKSFDDMGGDKYDLENHDLDVFLSVDRTPLNEYNLHLDIGSAKRTQGGIISSSVLGISESNLKNSIAEIVNKLLDEYFYRELLVIAPDNKKITTYINDKVVSIDSSGNNQYLYKSVPRFHTQNITVKRAKFRPQSVQVEGESFSTNIEPQVQERFELEDFTPLMGTLKITVKDAVTKKVIQFDSKGLGKAPRITLRRRILFIPSPIRSKYSNSASEKTFSISKVGKYYISVKKDFYTVPLLPHIVMHEVVDDLHPKSLDQNNLDIYLKKSDPKYARRLSIILPGSGQYYLNKQGEAFGYFTGALLTGAMSIYSYMQYNQEVAHYADLKEQYIDSSESDWSTLESQMSHSKSRIDRLRPQFYAALVAGSLVWTFNIITVSW